MSEIKQFWKDNQFICYDGHYIWFNDRPDIKVAAQYPSNTIVDINNPDIEITNVKELSKKYIAIQYEEDKIQEALETMKDELEYREQTFKRAFKKVYDQDVSDDEMNEEYYEDLMSVCEAYHQIRVSNMHS
jgi:hypothetical protein